MSKSVGHKARKAVQWEEAKEHNAEQGGRPTRKKRDTNIMN